MKTYYELLNLPVRASQSEVYATFRRYAAAYRPTITVEQIFNDTRFRAVLNAYLTLNSSQRARYDEALKVRPQGYTPPVPLDEISMTERRLLQARIALWRQEMTEAIHLLRTLLEREDAFAPGWALLGEVYLIVHRIADGVAAYENALHHDPHNSDYLARLKHVRDVAAGKAELIVEPSPEEEILREQRLRRWRAATLIGLLGVAVVLFSFRYGLDEKALGFLDVPWRTVVFQAAGAMLIMLALGYGRILEPFERLMVWTSTVKAAKYSEVHSLPNGLMLFVLSCLCMWLAVGSFIVMSIVDDEWPLSTISVIGVCAVINAGLVLHLVYVLGVPFLGTLIFGGNAILIASMLGWWVGSFGAPQYD